MIGDAKKIRPGTTDRLTNRVTHPRMKARARTVTDGVDAAFLPEPWASADLMQTCGPALLAKNGPNEGNLSL